MNSKELVIGLKNFIDEIEVVVKNRVHLKPKKGTWGQSPQTLIGSRFGGNRRHGKESHTRMGPVKQSGH